MGTAQQALRSPTPRPGDSEQRSNPTPKAGRNLPAAIAVGLRHALRRPGRPAVPARWRFVLVVTAFAVFGVWEVFRALEAAGHQAAASSR